MILFVGQGGGILRYFKIIYTDIPQIVFAHKYETESHEIHLGRVPGRAEITFAENGTLYFSNNKSIPEGTLGINTYDESVFVTSRGAPHRHTTICIDGGKTECVPPEKLLYDLLSKPDTQSLFFVMAESVSTPRTCEKAKKIIENIIALQVGKSAKSAVLSQLFALFSLLTDDACASLVPKGGGCTHSGFMYCRRAKEYIAEHIYEKISVCDIADALSVSCGHLSRIFKSAASYTVVEYINKTKIDAACDILKNVGGTASELASLFNVSDEKYFCRLFKKYTGVSVREYKKTLTQRI